MRIVRRDSSMAATTPPQVAAHERDVGRLDGHVGAGAHRDADVGLGQGRRVVDPVADHGHDTAVGLQALDLASPSPPEAPRRAPARCRPGRDGRRGRSTIAGQHDHVEPAPRSAATAAARLRLQHVGHRDEPERARPRPPRRRRSCPRRPSAGSRGSSAVDSIPRSSMSARLPSSDAALPAPARPRPAPARSRTRHRRQREAAVLGRVTIASPSGCSEPCSAAAARASTVVLDLPGSAATTSVTRGPAHRERAGLVEDHGVVRCSGSSAAALRISTPCSAPAAGRRP